MLTIYGLYDPTDESEEIRYVGFTTKTAAKRLLKHIEESTGKKSAHYRKSRWIVALQRDKGVRPAWVILEELPEDGDWKEAERRWIAHYRALNHDLCNHTDGGDGVVGYKWTPEDRVKFTEAFKKRPPLSPEAIAKGALARTGLKASPEAIAKRTAKVKGTKRGPIHTDESKAKMSASRRGKKQTEERKKAASERLKGVRPSDATFAALSKARKGAKASDETRLKMSIAQTGRKHTPESIAKMCAVQKGHPVSDETKQKIAATKAKNRELRLGVKAAKASPLPSPDDSDFFTFE